MRAEDRSWEKIPHLINAGCCHRDADRSSNQCHYSALDRSFQKDLTRTEPQTLKHRESNRQNRAQTNPLNHPHNSNIE